MSWASVPPGAVEGVKCEVVREGPTDVTIPRIQARVIPSRSSCNTPGSGTHMIRWRRQKPQAAEAHEGRLEDLVRGVLVQEPQTTQLFLRKVAPVVLRVVRQVLGGAHPDTEDVVQEALVGILDALPRFRGECSALHFVRRVGLLTAMNARRRFRLRQQIAPMVEPPPADSFPGGGRSPAEDVDAERRRALFLSLLDELPQAQAEALGMHCLLGYTVAETAAAAGAPINTVRGRIVTAKAALRARLAADPVVREIVRGAS